MSRDQTQGVCFKCSQAVACCSDAHVRGLPGNPQSDHTRAGLEGHRPARSLQTKIVQHAAVLGGATSVA